MGQRAYITLDRLADMSTDELKVEWPRRYAAPAPDLSPDMLRLGVAYRLQEQKLGGLSRSTKALLRQVAAQPKNARGKGVVPRQLTPGSQLVRDWHGVGHTVTVLHKGFEYDGKIWRSLTAIAKAITGTHWNGPRFFGLSEPRT